MVWVDAPNGLKGHLRAVYGHLSPLKGSLGVFIELFTSIKWGLW